MSAPFETWRVGVFVRGQSRATNSPYAYWKVHLKPVPLTDEQYVRQCSFLEDAIREKIERESASSTGA